MHTPHHNVSHNPRRVIPDTADTGGPQVIGIVVFDGFSMLPAAEVADVFDKANQALTAGDRGTFYKTIFVSSDGGCVSSSAQIDVLTRSFGQVDTLRAVFVASGEYNDSATQDEACCQWLRDTTAEIDDVFAIGNGEALLSAAGLASRKQSARDDVPAFDVRSVASQRDHLTQSGVRQALEIIKQDFGVSGLKRVLELLPDTRLPEFAAITNDSGKSVREKIQESAQWITRNCNKSISVTVAAQTAGMSDRSYLRHFRAEMGVKPSEHLRRSRVELAAALLETSDLPVDKIARRCGLTSGECLARLFRQVWGISPTEYRSRVRVNQPRK